MLVASDNENATIQNIHSVPSFLRKLGKLSVSVWIPNDHINYSFKIIISTTNASKLRFQSENYIWKCHWFTMFSITQTFSVESVTFMVNAVFTARILTIFSIGLETFWKKNCLWLSFTYDFLQLKSNLFKNYEVYHLLYNYDPSNPPYRSTHHLCADKFYNLMNRPRYSLYRNIQVRTLKQI